MNLVVLMGRLGKDPEIRYTANQTAVANMDVATTEFASKDDGSRTEKVEWHRVIAFGKTAENCGKYLAKGRSVLVEGRLQTRSWEDKSGQNRYVTEVVANRVEFTGSGNGESKPVSSQQPKQQEPTWQGDFDDIPF